MTEISEILARPAVQQAIGALVHDAARAAGISNSHAEGIRMSIVGRLETGAPVEAAIAVVQAIVKPPITASAENVANFPSIGAIPMANPLTQRGPVR